MSKTLMASLLEGFGALAEGDFSIPFPSCVSSQLCHRWEESVSLITLTLKRKTVNCHRHRFIYSIG